MAETKERRVMPQDKVKITWVDSKFHKAGTSSEVHPVQAEKHIASGKAIKFGDKMPNIKEKKEEPVK